MEKLCYTCRKIRPLEDFYRAKGKKGDRFGICRSCLKSARDKKKNDILREIKNCPVCLKDFEVRFGRKYCSPKCLKYVNRTREREDLRSGKRKRFQGSSVWWRIASEEEKDVKRDRRKLRERSLDGYCKKIFDRAKLITKDTDLTVEFIKDSILANDECCSVSKIPYVYNNPYLSKFNLLAPSPDQIIPKGGYYKDNVQIVAFGINRFKSDLSNEEFLDLFNNIIRLNHHE